MTDHRIDLTEALEGWRGLAAYGEVAPYVTVKADMSWGAETRIASAGIKQRLDIPEGRNRGEKRRNRKKNKRPDTTEINAEGGGPGADHHDD